MAQFIHFDEAHSAAIKAVRDWLAQMPAVSALVIADIYGRLRLVLFPDADVKQLDRQLAQVCGPWWSGEILRHNDLDKASKIVFEQARESGRRDEDEPRLSVIDRHRSRTAWFAVPVEPIWAAPKDGPPVLVYYSFKGGMGRSTLLAAFAIQRAQNGERVCVIDFDLDSPGAGRLLSADTEGLTARWGAVDFLLERSIEGAPLSDYFHRCDRVAGSGEILVFPAGKLDEHYVDKLARVDLEEPPDERKSGLSMLLRRAHEELKPNWILVDARTGISEPAGQLLSGIAHLHILLGTTQDQSWQGLNRVLDRLGKERVLRDKQQAEVLLVQAMVPPGESAKVTKDAFLARAEREFTERYYAAVTDESDADSLWTLRDLDSLDAPHVPMAVEYDLKLASFGDITEVSEKLGAGPYAEITERILGRFVRESDA